MNDIYAQMEKIFDEYPGFRIFEAVRMAMEKQMEKAVNNGFDRKYWEIQLKDLMRVEHRANRRAGT